MKIIGKKDGGGIYLVATEKGMARVLNADEGEFFPEQPEGSILKQGYWEPYNGRPGELEKLIEAIEAANK